MAAHAETPDEEVLDEVCVQVVGLGGDSLCEPQRLPRATDVLKLRDVLREVLARGLCGNDVLVHDGCPLTHGVGKPFEDAGDGTLVLTVVYSRELSEGDWVRYNGPYLLLHQVHPGTSCLIKEIGDKGYCTVEIAEDGGRRTARVCVGHLSRTAEAPPPIPGGFERDQTVFYVGPPTNLLSTESRGSVVAAGVIEGAVQVRFGRATTMSLPASQLSALPPSERVPPRSSRRCTERLCPLLVAALCPPAPPVPPPPALPPSR